MYGEMEKKDEMTVIRREADLVTSIVFATTTEFHLESLHSFLTRNWAWSC